MLRCACLSKHSQSMCEKSKPQSRRYGMMFWILSNPENSGDFIDELCLVFIQYRSGKSMDFELIAHNFRTESYSIIFRC